MNSFWNEYNFGKVGYLNLITGSNLAHIKKDELITIYNEINFHSELQTENENRDRARTLICTNRKEALREAGQFDFDSTLQFAHEKPRQDSTLVSFEFLQFTIANATFQ